VLFIVVPQKAIPALPTGLLSKAKKETIVIDVGNYYPFRDGRIDEMENGLTESGWVERQIGWPVVKVLNTVIARALAEAGRPAGSKDRIAFPISGDNPKAKEIVAQIIDQMGFDSVDAGPTQNRGDNNLDLLLTARTDESGASVVAKSTGLHLSPNEEGIKGVFSRGGCGLASPSGSPPIGEHRVLTVNGGINRQRVFMKWRKAPGVFPGDTVQATHHRPSESFSKRAFRVVSDCGCDLGKPLGFRR
jgi:hypothetical protein